MGSPAAPPQKVPRYTLRSETRSVLTDVTVTDREGRPVHGLKASAFHLFDDNQPQDLASFDEHTGKEATPAAPARASRPGV
ncbi:MAG TPA: hypothetical protein VNW54_00020 [Granulicella sp.]|nr:hypothetical protein [Granulicella sp.]